MDDSSRCLAGAMVAGVVFFLVLAFNPRPISDPFAWGQAWLAGCLSPFSLIIINWIRQRKED